MSDIDRAPVEHRGRTPDGARVLRGSVRDNRRSLIASTALLSLHQFCEVSVPVLIGVAVDRALGHADVASLIRWLTVLALIFLVLTVAYRYGARIAMTAAQGEAHRLRMRCAATIIEDTPPTATGLRDGEMLSIANSDADETGNLLRYVPQAGSAVMALIACAAVLIGIDTALGITVLIAVPLALSVVQLLSPFTTRLIGAQQHHIGRSTALATDLVTGMRTLRGIGALGIASDRYREADGRARLAMRRAAIGHGAFFGAATGVTGLIAVGVAALAGWFALSGQISVGALITVLGVAQFLTEPLAIAAMLPGRVATARASAERISTLTARHRRAGDTTAPIDHDSTTVPCPGEFVAVRAPDSAAARAYASTIGSDHRSGLLVEPHSVDLFTGTIWSNLVVDPHAAPPRATVVELLQALGSLDILSGGGTEALDTPVSDRGLSLSGGQRQRLALARALIRDPGTLVLHDPTTAVDAMTERVVAEAVYRHRHGRGATRSTTVITNSPAWLRVADRVVALPGCATTEPAS
ncbi:ABC transporter ATP-binding protein [Streptomyces sp. SID6673]|nr:ABC transporter ATP-binding protein [Streptomyces sp. SID11726]NEB24612.1 ABC transporter ATP-binding protein [Streptomyces sp. SID6673]